MLRRTFIQAGGALAVGASFASAMARAEGAGWTRYALTTRVDLAKPGAPADLWLPLAEDRAGWQRAGQPRFQTTGQARVVRDPRYGAAMLHVNWGQGGGPRTVELTQAVSTRDRTADGAALTPAEQRFWTAPTASLPTGGIVGGTARRITAGHAEPPAKARAIYDWVVDNTFRDAAVRGCGTGGVENMLRTGYLGGKCADINSLFVALCRACGLPARDVYGVRLGPSAFVKVLGTSGPDVTRAQHCRAEVWLPGQGWLPVDPADVRKVVLEAKLAPDSLEVRAQRARLFGSWEMNWAAYNSAGDIALPGASRPPAEHFLMYPLAMTPEGELDQLDPARFRYSLTSRTLI